MSPLVPREPRPEPEPEVLDPAILEQAAEEAEPGVDLHLPHVDPAITKGRALEGEAVGVPDLGEVEVPTALRREIERAMKLYPEKRSASLPALWAVQRRYGWCTPEGIMQAAAVMGLTPAYLESVASFYDLFHLKPQGKHAVLVCTNIACWLRGADSLLNAICEAAGTRPGETSADGKVFVSGFECLGACDLAPMASIDERYYGPLVDEDAATIVEQLRGKQEVLPERSLALRGAAGGMRSPADDRLSKHALGKPLRPRPKSAKVKTQSPKMPKPAKRPTKPRKQS